MKLLDRAIKLLMSPSYSLYKFASRYVESYEKFSYDFEKNGEANFLDALSIQDVITVLDVGANIGDWTKIALSKFTKATVHSFELSETTYQTLSENLSGESRVVLNNVGLADKDGFVEYKDYGQNFGGNTIINDADFHYGIRKPTIKKGRLLTGAQYCRDNNIEAIDLLKIDVEGAEHLVLLGFADLLEKGRVKTIQFEYGYTNADAKFLIKDFYKLLTNYGYILGPLKPSGVLFMDFDYALNKFKSGPNYVAVHQNQKSIISAVKGKPIRGYPRR